MTRRWFLASTAAVVTNAVFDPERALWIAGAKHVSIPAPKPKMLCWACRLSVEARLRIYVPTEAAIRRGPFRYELDKHVNGRWETVLVSPGGAAATLPEMASVAAAVYGRVPSGLAPNADYPAWRLIHSDQ